jgi:hypothetical protein
VVLVIWLFGSVVVEGYWEVLITGCKGSVSDGVGLIWGVVLGSDVVGYWVMQILQCVVL